MTFIFVLLCSHANAAFMFDWAVPAHSWSVGTLGPYTFSDVGTSGIDLRRTLTENSPGILRSGRPVTVTAAAFVTDEHTLRLGMNGLKAEGFLGVTMVLEFFEEGTTTPTAVTVSGMTFYDVDHHSEQHKWREQLEFSATAFGGGACVMGFGAVRRRRRENNQEATT